MLACMAANAQVLFQETYVTRRGDSNIDKKGTYWPYASEWFTGYTGASGEVTGNQFDNDYTDVKSGYASIRAKKLNESSSYSAVLFFQANKSAYCKFVGALPNVPEGGAKLHFEIATTENDGTDLSKFGVKVNETELTVPATTMPAKGITTEIALDLPVGQLDSIKFSLDNDGVEKAIARFWIATPTTGIDNVNANAPKAAKVIENGQLYIIRNGVKYNAAGAIVK